MFTIEEILTATQGQLINGPSKGSVRSVSIDSRKVAPGEVFVAVKGEIFDGHDFVNDVTAKGIRVVVVHKAIELKENRVSVIRVKDTTRALGDIARFHRLRFNIPIITLTGSAGKTTTKEMLAAVLSRKYNVLKNEGTQNNHIGVPLTLLKLTSKHNMVVLECGTNQPGDIVWLADVARAQVAIFTNIGESHLEKLKTPQGVLKEKWQLTSFLPDNGTIIYNADDPLLLAQAKKTKSFKAISIAIKKSADVRAEGLALEDERSITFTIAKKIFILKSCGTTNVYNALCAYACGRLFQVPVSEIADALKKFDFPSGRGQIVRLGRGWLINDSYNANPLSMRSALETLEAINVHGKRIFIAADMLELGSKAKALHRTIGQEVARSSVSILITVGQLAKEMAKSAGSTNKKLQVFACSDLEGAQKYLMNVFSNGDAVLIKGSRRMAMERMSEFLLTSPKGEAE